MFEILEKCLNAVRLARGDLAQLRGQARNIVICSAKNGIVQEFSSTSLKGVGIRVLADAKAWGFSSTNLLGTSSVSNAYREALKLARAASGTKQRLIPFSEVRVEKADFKSPVKKRPREFSSEELRKIASEACEGAQEAGPNVVDATCTYVSLEDDKYFLSSEGSRIHQQGTRVLLYVTVIAKDGGLIVPATETLDHTGGLEIFDETSPRSLGKAVAEKAVRLLKAKAPPSGKLHVVIHPTLCATLLHEAIGHPLEADMAMAGGGFGYQIDKLVSSKLITIYDDGRVSGGLGNFHFDDEGIACKHTVLIENGILKSFMHDRTSAAAASASTTGNAHAWDYSVEPLIRQTNIGIEAGDYSEEEMTEDIKEGLFLEGTFGGQADANADFTFGFQNARWIRNGKLIEELRGANVAGNAIEVFKTIDAVGKETVLRPGACGKSQWAIQGRVVPAIRCEIMVGGAGN